MRRRLPSSDVVRHQTDVPRWNAHMKSALAEIAVLQGDPDRAARLFAEARDRYTSNADAAGVAAVEERLRSLAKSPQRGRKSRPATTSSTSTRKGGSNEPDTRTGTR